MKHLKLLILYIVLISPFKIFSSLAVNQPTQSANFLKSNPIDDKVKNIINNTHSTPRLGIRKSDDGSTDIGQQYIQTRKTKHTLLPRIKSNFSILRGNNSDYDNYPAGSALFKDYPSLAAKFDKLINLIKQEPKFKAFFNKVHLNILNELYEYLMAIYTNFNVQHVGIKETQTKDGQAALQINIPLFLQNESEYEANKKTLIINHMVNIIESQLNGKIRSVSPQVPHLFATSAGKTLIQNDFSIDLTHFIIKQIEPEMIKAKKMFLDGLVVYLSFFEEFTSYLMQPHPKHSKDFTAFVHIAESINSFLYGDEDISVPAEDKIKTVLTKMNPPFFTFNYDDIRALRLIPQLAKSLPANTKSIQWPSHLVEAANGITYINGHPIAYFTDSTGNVVKEDKAKHLYIIMQAGKNFFQEELKAQPNWLNSWDGIASILRGCFGNFAALVGLEILDPCMESLIKNAIDTMNGKDVNETDSFDSVCKNYINSFKSKPVVIPADQQSQNLSNISNLLPTTFSDSSSPLPDNTNALTPNINDVNSINNNNMLSPDLDDISNENISSALMQ